MFAISQQNDDTRLLHGFINLKDTYYTANVDKHFRNYLRFMWEGQLFEYTCQPNNGLACAPILFTKLMKPIFGQLRAEGLLSIINIDDSYMQGNSYRDCLHNVQCTRDLISQLGFSINEKNQCSNQSKC
jgi:hypothetical protein